MTDQRLPFAEIEVPCTTCGRMVLQAKRKQGRHARFCSDECKHAAKLRWQATWRSKNPHWSRDWYRRLKAGVGAKSGKALMPGPVGPSRADFFPVASNFDHAEGDAALTQRPEDVGFGPAERLKSPEYFPPDRVLEPGRGEVESPETWPP